MKRALLVVIAALAALIVAPRAAHAQRVEVSASVDADAVELGETITYTLQATSMGASAPTAPQPGATAGFRIEGTSSAPMHMAVNINGVPSTVESLTTAWTLRATRIGTFTLGPASVSVGGTRRTARPVRVTVVPQGQGSAPRRRPRSNTPFDPFAGSPFDPFGGTPFDPFKDLFDDLVPQRPPEPTGDPKLSLEAPRAPTAFLHATVDKTRAVVGEQVTLSMYLYSVPGVRLGKARDIRVPTTTDFVRRPLMAEGKEINLGRVMVGDQLWDVELISKDALFPLKTGTLPIGAMSMSLPSLRVGFRESEALQVDVTEPPVAGRPAGYTIGDVGDFSLQASVAPRALAQGGSVGVTVELRGTGNLPAKLPLPELPGVEWLEAQSRENLGAVQSDRFGGSRTFSYVLKIHRAGAVDLGEVRLPYFDPTTRRYGVARASLGILDVTPGETRDAGADEVEPTLPDLPAPRRALEGATERSYLTERPGYWAALFGTPLACALGIGAHGLLRRARERRAQAKPSPSRVARERQREAERALEGEDGKAALSAAARALEAAVLARSGVNVRGAAGDEAARELEGAGVPAEAAREVVRVLRACEDARFSPGGVSMSAARELWKQATAVIDRVPEGPRA